MKSDQLSYKRATVVSLIGLGIQGLMALVLLLYALIGADAAALTGSLYLLLGLPVWFVLSLVFHQHRLARIEAAEEEMLRTGSAAQASVFQEAGSDLRVATRKLEWMHRYLLPAVSLLIGGALLILGWLRYSSGIEIVRSEAALPGLTGWAMTIGLCIAAIGFIFARFVAGMAKQEVWSNLRAGATWAVGAAVIGLLIALAHGISFAASDALLRRLPVIIPIIMAVLGIEIFLNFVLSVYRPRKPGEYPRPAFDSRVLGFLAAPDRIAESISEAVNYQFGLDVSSTWFYRLFSRSLAFLLFVGGAVIWILTSFAVVGPDEKAIVLRSGQLQRVIDSDVALKLPWPFETVERFNAQHITELQLGAPAHAHDHGANAPILWTEDHGVDEHFMLVRASEEGSSASAAGDDYALVSAEIPLQYVVDDLRTYLWLAADSDDPNDPDKHRRELLRSVAVRVVTEYLATRTIDAVLGAARDEINAELHNRIEARFAELNIDPATGEPRGAGVKIVFVGIVGAHPPFAAQVGESFEYVVNAEQRREATIELARAQAIRTLASVAGDVELARRIVTELDELERLTDRNGDDETVALKQLAIEDLIYDAGGEAAGLLLDARADRWVRHMEFRGRATRQTGRLAMYRAAPEVYLAGLFLDALQEAVRNSRLYITTFEAPGVTVNFENVESTFDDLLSETRAREEN